MRTCLEKKYLRDGFYYEGQGPGSGVARWNANLNRFFYNVENFCGVSVKSAKHPEDNDESDLFWPQKVLNRAKYIPLADEET